MWRSNLSRAWVEASRAPLFLDVSTAVKYICAAIVSCRCLLMLSVVRFGAKPDASVRASRCRGRAMI